MTSSSTKANNQKKKKQLKFFLLIFILLLFFSVAPFAFSLLILFFLLFFYSYEGSPVEDEDADARDEVPRPAERVLTQFHVRVLPMLSRKHVQGVQRKDLPERERLVECSVLLLLLLPLFVFGQKMHTCHESVEDQRGCSEEDAEL